MGVGEAVGYVLIALGSYFAYKIIEFIVSPRARGRAHLRNHLSNGGVSPAVIGNDIIEAAVEFAAIYTRDVCGGKLEGDVYFMFIEKLANIIAGGFSGTMMDEDTSDEWERLKQAASQGWRRGARI